MSYTPFYLQSRYNINNMPVREYDLNDLEADPEFQFRTERFLGSLGEGDDIFEYLRDEDFNLTKAMTRYASSGNFTEQQKEDYKYLRQRFDGANVGSTSQYVELIKDGFIDMVSDPTLIAAAFFTPWTGGGSLATRATLGRGAAQGLKMLGQANKGALSKAKLNKAIANGSLREAAKTATKVSTGIGAIEAGGWMGLHNHAHQNIEINTRIRQAYSAKELVGNIALGTLMGGVIGYGGQKWSNYANPILQLNNAPKVFADDFLGNVRLKFNKAWDNVVGRTIAGNAAFLRTIADQGIESARRLRGLFDSDAQLNIGVRNNKKVEWSFPELLNRRRGRYLFETDGPTPGFWQIINDVAPDGIFKQADELAIIRYLRGNKQALRGATPKIKKVAKDLRKYFDNIAKEAEEAGFGNLRVENYFPRQWNRQKIKDNPKEFRDMLAEDLLGKKPNKLTAKESREMQEIVDGMLNKNNQLYQSHSNLLTHGRKFKNLNDNKYEKFLTNELVSVTASYALNAANTIQTKISFLGGRPKSKVVKKKDLEGNDVLTFQSLQESKVDQFIKTHVDPIDAELFRKTGRNLSRRDRQNMVNAFKSVTGDVNFFDGQWSQGIYDSIKLANAMAYLPLATVSSLSEGLIAMARKGGAKSSTKRLAFHTENGVRFLTTDLKRALVERRGLSEVEANREANKVFIAVDDIQSDLTNRLAGDGLQTAGLNRIARGFYKLNLLLPWTKTIELAAFNTGRDIVEENLVQLAKLQKAGVNIFDDVGNFVRTTKGKDKEILKNLEGLDGTWGGKGNLYQRVTYLKEQIYDLGIDVEQGLKWLNNGANRETAFWRNEMSMAGGRFSRSVILPTSREFSKVPQFMTHPRWDILTQFLRYPTAFSNTVLKNFARDILNNPKANGPRFAAFVVGATAIARGTNYWRSSDERQREYDRNARELDDDSVAGKAFDAIVGRSFDENLRAFQRVGLLGPYEYIQRYKDAYKANPNMFLAATSLGGPVMSDFTGSAVYGRGAFETLAKKTPLIGTRNVVKRYTGVDPFEPLLEGAKEQDEKVGEFLEDFFGTEPGKRTGIGYDNIDYGRPGYAKGGIVRDGFQNLGRMQYNLGGEAKEEPRAFRNNNPLNMILGTVDLANGTFTGYDNVARYNGVVGMDSRNLGGLRDNGVDYQLESFAMFDNVELGARANFHNLRKNYNGLTLAQIGEKFSRTDTDTYAQNVANFSGVDVNSVIDFENNPDQAIKIFRGMARLEAGAYDPRLTDEMLLRAYNNSKKSLDDSVYFKSEWAEDKASAAELAKNLLKD